MELRECKNNKETLELLKAQTLSNNIFEHKPKCTVRLRNAYGEAPKNFLVVTKAELTNILFEELKNLDINKKS